MRIIFQVWAALIPLSLFLFIIFPVGILASLFKELPTRLKIVTPAWRLFGYLGLRLGCLAKIQRTDFRSARFKVIISPALYICNHQSLIDIPLLLAHFVIPPIMKKEIMRLPLFGIVAKASGGMPVDRKNRGSRIKVLKMSQQRILSGFPVQYYPEGTRSKTDKPKAFEDIKARLMEFAFDNNIPVVACTVYGTNNLLTRNGMVKPFTKLGLNLAKEIYPKNFKDKEEFTRFCWGTVLKEYDRLEEKMTS
ncbi:1-acyl-sn-glycerol-3-phosphate acyltransferase [Bacteriovoracaceae bacterium]|nr:1-acyl-sn-glycerol-3-phosphate acyltransferase [Bacteriovoracaceae bacterium]